MFTREELWFINEVFLNYGLNDEAMGIIIERFNLPQSLQDLKDFLEFLGESY